MISNEKKSWIYYLLGFKFVNDDANLYGYIRDILYDGRDFDDKDLFMIIQNKKPLSDKSEVCSFIIWLRDKKINYLLN